MFGGKGAVVAWRALEMLQRAGLCPADPDGISITEVRAGRGGGGEIFGALNQSKATAPHIEVALGGKRFPDPDRPVSDSVVVFVL